ncbi:hypothetical protein CDAR_411111 [Caerostris darwini]|uniref:Uncharacterized protein n=1 Tax=Caerostris darwini TaxID=1538125 RepID=A0AAV4SE84_9ARAC|nr:hypothetical protein CDAR_411111 [Caerostris darwini]
MTIFVAVEVSERAGESSLIEGDVWSQFLVQSSTLNSELNDSARLHPSRSMHPDPELALVVCCTTSSRTAKVYCLLEPPSLYWVFPL